MNATNFMNNMFGKIAPGMCRLSMNGEIAVKTSNGYKTYNTKTGRLTNCSNFVFDIGEDFFFLIPTNKANKGDIILVGGKPKCVVEVKEDEAFKITCKKLNMMWLNEYSNTLPWYDGDIFDGEIEYEIIERFCKKDHAEDNLNCYYDYMISSEEK